MAEASIQRMHAHALKKIADVSASDILNAIRHPDLWNTTNCGKYWYRFTGHFCGNFEVTERQTGRIPV